MLKRNILFPALLIFCLIFLTSCGDKQPAPIRPQDYPLPHIRYFESSHTGEESITFTLYDYDLELLSRQQIWEITGEDIIEVEITPDGKYVLVHHAILDELSMFYEIYNLESPAPNEPMVFHRDTEELTEISGYEVFLDFAVYKNGFVIGDPDIQALMDETESEVYMYAWVNLIAGVVEEIPLLTTMEGVPYLLYVPSGGGSIDFMRPGSNQILRLEWFTAKTSLMQELYNKENDPRRLLMYIGSFSHFTDVLSPRPGSGNDQVNVGLRHAENYIPLAPGDYPIWSLWDKYILMRVFPEDVMEMILAGTDPKATLGYILQKSESPKFAVWDIEKKERMELSLTSADPIALPKPAFDPLSDTFAFSELPPIYELPEDGSMAVTTSIIVFSIPKNKRVTTISGIANVDQDTGMAFYRP